MPKYDVAVYNQKVRDCVAEGDRHPRLNDDWADIHYFEVKAPSAEAARDKILNAHPASQGYVIESVDEMDED
mgnify:CR=1 FL=1